MLAFSNLGQLIKKGGGAEDCITDPKDRRVEVC